LLRRVRGDRRTRAGHQPRGRQECGLPWAGQPEKAIHPHQGDRPMITDERDLATSLRTVDTPPSLTLDPDQVLGRAHRTDRRHRAGRGALATGSVAAVAATALCATGTAVGPIAVLPAAPWTDGCQGIVEGATGASINLDQV